NALALTKRAGLIAWARSPQVAAAARIARSTRAANTCQDLSHPSPARTRTETIPVNGRTVATATIRSAIQVSRHQSSASRREVQKQRPRAASAVTPASPVGRLLDQAVGRSRLEARHVVGDSTRPAQQCD